MKRCWMILLAAALLLTGCRRKTPAEGPALTDDIDYMPVVEAADLASAGITLADDPHGVSSQATTEITEQGIFFFDRDAGLLMFNDWQTNTTYPLCAKANCRHDGPDCTAVYFAETNRIGRLGNKWYRFLFAGEVFAGDYSTEIRSYDLDGGNEKTVAVFPHEIDFRTICS